MDWGVDLNLIDEEEVINEIAKPVDVEGIADQMSHKQSGATMKSRDLILAGTITN